MVWLEPGCGRRRRRVDGLNQDEAVTMPIRFCVIPDPVFPDGTPSDLAEISAPAIRSSVSCSARPGIESTPVFEVFAGEDPHGM